MSWREISSVKAKNFVDQYRERHQFESIKFQNITILEKIWMKKIVIKDTLPNVTKVLLYFQYLCISDT